MKKSFYGILALIISLSLCLPLASCGKRMKKYTSTYFDYFDTYATATLFASSDEEYKMLDGIFKSELEKYHQLLDIYSQYENIVNLYTVNASAGGEAVEVSDELFDFISQAVDTHKMTNGYTSISIGAITSVWKQALNTNTLPDEDILKESAKHIDISHIILDSTNKTVTLTDSKMSLDAGALGKGYAADKIGNALRDAGCESFLLDLGGNLKAHGNKPDGSPWLGGIRDPNELEGSLDLSINISDRALSTSGSYHRGFELDGTVYHHIISPYTLRPENIFSSVSVICRDSYVSDALSTALFSMSLEDGQMLIASIENAEAVWIFADGKIVTTDGITPTT